MSPVLRIGLSVVLVVALVFVGLAVGWALWGRRLWSGWGYGMGPGMMNGWGAPGTPCAAPRVHWGCGSSSWGYGEPASGELTMEQAREAAEQYVESLGYAGLEIVEVMEFEHNFYAIVREADSRMGAMELLVDKWSGEVIPEVGANMMWNERYGMHGRGGMRGGTRGIDSLDEVEVLEIAQRWLDAHRPGMTMEEHVQPFYGYYTVHTLRDGEVEGMLSVHGSTGQVWYHTWHGEYVP